MLTNICTFEKPETPEQPEKPLQPVLFRPLSFSVFPFRQERKQKEERHTKRKEIDVAIDEGGGSGKDEGAPQEAGGKEDQKANVLLAIKKQETNTKGKPQARACPQVAAMIP